jgi:uncharacterized protein YcnI
VRLALVAATIALVVPAAAAAHVTIAPPFVDDGVESEIAFATPNERPPHATITVRATAPPGISVVSATAPAGWREAVDGSTVTWSGGRLGDRTTASFPMRIVARVRAGTYAFTSVQTYDDGATVTWKASLSVLPAAGAAAPKQHPWGAVAAALAGIVVIGGSLLGLRLLRRRPLQEK